MSHRGRRGVIIIIMMSEWTALSVGSYSYLPSLFSPFVQQQRIPAMGKTSLLALLGATQVKVQNSHTI